jgi:membrane protein
MWEVLWKFLDPYLFGPWSNRPEPLPGLLRLLRYPYAVLRDLSRGQINLRAMSLVFTTLMALIPLVAFSFALLKAFGMHDDLEPVVFEFFRPVGDSATELTAKVMGFADSVSGGLVGSVGFALLLWTLLDTIEKVEDSFNFLWRVQQPRSFARRITEYLTLVIVGPLMLVGFLGLAHAAMSSESMHRLVTLPLMDRVMSAGLQLAPYLMVTLIFTALYLFIPNTKVRLLPALVGGVTAGVIWAAVGKLFTAFVVFSTRLTIVYAGFAIIVVALLWTYLGWLILLIGAQLSFYVQNRNYLRLGLVELRLSSVEMEELALKIMFLIGSAHTAGARQWSVQGLSSQLGLPALAVSQLVNGLERAQLLTTTDREKLVPARDIGHIRLQQILDVARNQRSGHLAPRELPLPPVDRLNAALAAAWRSGCGERTLRDLVEES